MTSLPGKRMGSEFLRNEMTKKERWVWPSLKSNILLIQIPVKLIPFLYPLGQIKTRADCPGKIFVMDMIKCFTTSSYPHT